MKLKVYGIKGFKLVNTFINYVFIFCCFINSVVVFVVLDVVVCFVVRFSFISVTLINQKINMQKFVTILSSMHEDDAGECDNH